jgi:hypothetical protein
MSVTLYFAEESPLDPKDTQGLSDSAPLLNGSRDAAHASNEPNNERFPNGHVGLNNVSANNNTEEFTNVNSNTENGGVFNDGPGAVLVNILTRMRHLPPGMHSVLLVMALTWVRYQITYIHAYRLLADGLFSIFYSSSRLMIYPCFILPCSCHGFPFSFLTLTGWDAKFTMGIQMEI